MSENGTVITINIMKLDMTTQEIIKAIAKKHCSLVEWQKIADVKIDSDNIIVALYEKSQCVLKVVRQTWDKDGVVGYYADVNAEVFYCETLADAMDTAKDAIELMSASANKSKA